MKNPETFTLTLCEDGKPRILEFVSVASYQRLRHRELCLWLLCAFLFAWLMSLEYRVSVVDKHVNETSAACELNTKTLGLDLKILGDHEERLNSHAGYIAELAKRIIRMNSEALKIQGMEITNKLRTNQVYYLNNWR